MQPLPPYLRHLQRMGFLETVTKEGGVPETKGGAVLACRGGGVMWLASLQGVGETYVLGGRTKLPLNFASPVIDSSRRTEKNPTYYGQLKVRVPDWCLR